MLLEIGSFMKYFFKDKRLEFNKFKVFYPFFLE